MSSKAVTEKPDYDNLPGSGFRSTRETAPSTVQADDPRLARWFGLVGLMLVTLGSVALFATATGRTAFLIPGWILGPVGASFFLIIGMAFLLFHAALDRDLQIRRTYGLLGYCFLAGAILITALPIRGPAGSQFLPWGFIGLVIALLFLLPFIRNETELSWQNTALAVVGSVGVVLAATGLIGGSVSEAFLLGAEQRPPHALLLSLLGLSYVWAFVGMKGTNTDAGYWSGLGLGIAGALVFLWAFGRSVLPPLFFSWGWTHYRPAPFLVPSGLVLMSLGLVYVGVSTGLCSDNRFVVLFRRELAAFFYSPIAYIVLLSFAVLSCWLFFLFVYDLSNASARVRVFPEPVIKEYLLAFSPVFCLVFAVPALTMRLLSEEHRTGTLEVLFTAPLGETVVVLSKFLAVWVFFMLVWVPWGICLIAFRVEGGQQFEYRPLLIYYLMLACTGAGFLSMGLFFSSLTRNQIVAAILTFMGMLFLTVLYWAKMTLQPQQGEASGWVPLLAHASYLDLWISSLLYAEITPKYYVFHLSAAVFWLFLTIKVLESRRWR